MESCLANSNGIEPKETKENEIVAKGDLVAQSCLPLFDKQEESEEQFASNSSRQTKATKDVTKCCVSNQEKCETNCNKLLLFHF
jgi:hypothetical protein